MVFQQPSVKLLFYGLAKYQATRASGETNFYLSVLLELKNTLQKNEVFC